MRGLRSIKEYLNIRINQAMYQGFNPFKPNDKSMCEFLRLVSVWRTDDMKAAMRAHATE